MSSSPATSLYQHVYSTYSPFQKICTDELLSNLDPVTFSYNCSKGSVSSVLLLSISAFMLGVL